MPRVEIGVALANAEKLLKHYHLLYNTLITAGALERH